MKRTHQYTWKGTDNAVKLYELLRITLGNDYNSWHKNKDYKDALQLAHEVIFGYEDKVKDIHKKGLDVQVTFLTGNKHQAHWRVKRMPQYVQAVLWAYDAKVIDATTRDRYINEITTAALEKLGK